ncbi:AAA family ATPase [Paenibacillus sp. GCM10012307]|uniref:MoxR family ATPase n=1 Tax=Paenibacillus roseus TaxID=2798579 RepID=A0A934JA36_9BACL|nr:MoxR family ATPase [Paenibacillus roseus]MBJ6363058.1 MoxR family ATPase [Paenibacillus roseus]
MNHHIEDLKICALIRNNLESSILGKSKEISRLLTALLAGGHVLLEDVPGTGKTQLVKSLARSIGGQFRRIQCNPDLLPTDITGVSIYHPKEEAFQFRPGPVVANIVLADEINRATTKTQSALLEVMEERRVSVDGFTHELPVPFLLFATQNPIEFEGTYILPEAQLDRFMMKLTLGYPDEQTEKQMLLLHHNGRPAEQLEQVASIEDIVRLQAKVRNIHVDDAIADYLVQIIRRTRSHAAVQLGASPRAALSLLAAAKAHAFLDDRQYVIPDDVKELVPAVLEHRLLLQAEARINGVTPLDILNDIVGQTKVPVRLER